MVCRSAGPHVHLPCEYGFQRPSLFTPLSMLHAPANLRTQIKRTQIHSGYLFEITRCAKVCTASLSHDDVEPTPMRAFRNARDPLLTWLALQQRFASCKGQRDCLYYYADHSAKSGIAKLPVKVPCFFKISSMTWLGLIPVSCWNWVIWSYGLYEAKDVARDADDTTFSRSLV